MESELKSPSDKVNIEKSVDLENTDSNNNNNNNDEIFVKEDKVIEKVEKNPDKNESVQTESMPITSDYVLPDIVLPSMDFDDFNKKDSIDDASSVTTGFSTTIMDRDNDLRSYQHPFRQQRQLINQQPQFHPHYQAIDQAFPQQTPDFAQGQYYPQEPHNVQPAYNQQAVYYSIPGYSKDQPFRPTIARPKHFPSPLSGANPHQQQQQPFIQQPAVGYQPRLESRFIDPNFNPIHQLQQMHPQPPTPRTSLQRQKQIEANDVVCDA